MRILRKAAALSVLCLTFAITGRAQSLVDDIRAYAFFAPGVKTMPTQSTVQFGFGGEAVITEHLFFGGELSYLGPAQKIFNGGIAILSLNLGHSFLGKGRWTPFVTGGYSLLTDLFDTKHGFNAGAGMDVQAWKRLGVRVEVRDLVGVSSGGQFLGVRVGPVLNFR